MGFDPGSSAFSGFAKLVKGMSLVEIFLIWSFSEKEALAIKISLPSNISLDKFIAEHSHSLYNSRFSVKGSYLPKFVLAGLELIIL